MHPTSPTLDLTVQYQTDFSCREVMEIRTVPVLLLYQAGKKVVASHVWLDFACPAL